MTKDEKVLKKNIKEAVNEVFRDYDKLSRKMVLEHMNDMMYDIYRYTFTKPSKDLLISYLLSIKKTFEKELFKSNLNDILSEDREEKQDARKK